MPTRRAVALVIFSEAEASRILVVRRPDDDEDLPGVWGLPATSIRPGEREERAASRIGTQKLGTPVHLGPRLAHGSQGRSQGRLIMSVFQARLEGDGVNLGAGGDPGVTYYTAWKWAGQKALEEGARRGSLCCQLFLTSSSQRLKW